jgi:endoglucanase
MVMASAVRRSWVLSVAVGTVVALTVGVTGAAAHPPVRRAPSGGGGAPVVRVNQVGYPSVAAKRAYLMSGVAETGASFTVRSSTGTVAFTGPVGADLGSWSSSYGHVYALDFSVSTTGTYTIAVTGPANATSPAFRIDAPATLYAGPLANSVSFYQTQRDGPSYVANALRSAPGHLNDQTAMTYLTPKASSSGSFSGDLTSLGVRIDASGGWWDAGDYLKFVATTDYTDAILLAAVRDYPTQVGSTMSAEARFGTDWLLKMWDDTSKTLYYQVGIGEGNAKTVGDHDLWRLPQADDTYGGTDPVYRYIRNRPVFRAGAPGSLVSPNLAGRNAAAFAECYQTFKTSDPTYANRCLLAAEHIFDLANTNPSGNLLTVIPYSFYPEVEWRDDLELGAAELYLATAGGGLPGGLPHSDPSYYLQQAAHWANAYITGPNDAADTLNLYDVSGFAHYELYRALGQAGSPTNLEVTQAALLADLKKQLDAAVARAGTDPFQFGFPWATWDTTSHGAGLVVMASEYDQLTAGSSYAVWSSRWLANILGANAWGLSFIVGDGATFPHCLQHQVANLAGSLDGSPPVLAGAAVEGPNSAPTKGTVSGMRACPPSGSDAYAQFNGSGAQFKDDVQSYDNTEPAVDLTATSPLALARLAAGLN